MNLWIVAMTIPAILFFAQSFLTIEALREMTSLISGLAMLSPLLALIQLSMIVRGTAGATWQNILCLVITIAAAVMVWRSSTFAL